MDPLLKHEGFSSNRHVSFFSGICLLGGGFSNINFVYFQPENYLEKIPILTNIFQMGWNYQLDLFFTGDTY